MTTSFLKCHATQLLNETRIKIEWEKGVQHFSIDKTECPVSYAIFLALTDFFEEEHSNLSSVSICVNDLFAFNVLSVYLQQWKKNHWVTSHGKPVSYVDILSALYDTLSNHKITYNVIFEKV